MKKYLVALLIAVLTVGAADAQFGKLTKGLGKKIENAAKKEAAKAKEEVKQKSQQEAAKQRGQDTLDKLRQEQEAKSTSSGSSNGSSSSSYTPYVDEEYEAPKAKKQEPLEDDEYIVSNYRSFDDQSVAIKGDNLGMYSKARKTDWEELQKYAYDPENWMLETQWIENNALYYVYRWKKAVEAKDLEKMCDHVIIERLSWCITQILKIANDKSYRELTEKEYIQLVDDYNKAGEDFSAIIWAGQPQNPISSKDRTTPEKKAEYTQNTIKIWNWCLDKADEAKAANMPNTMGFYVSQVIGFRMLNISWSYATGDEPGFAEFDSRLYNLWSDCSDEFRAKNELLTVAEVKGERKATEERWAKEAAERKAKEEAEIAANTQDWPESNMPELHSTAMQVMKAKYPNRKVLRISIPNTHWEVFYQGIHIERREVQLWVEYEHESGRKIAEEHYMAQWHNGSGYGKAKHSGGPNRYFWVRQK